MAEEKDEVEEELEMKGAFVESLKRNNKKIRNDRAVSITEDTELLYKRAVEDLKVKLRKMQRDRESMLDLSPTNALSLTLASEFDCDEFVTKDLDLGFQIRQVELKLEIAEAQYKHLFGG